MKFEQALTRSFGQLGLTAGRYGRHGLIAWLFPVDGRLSVVEIELIQLPVAEGLEWEPLLQRRDLIGEADRKAKQFARTPPAALSRDTLVQIPYQSLTLAFSDERNGLNDQLEEYARLLSAALDDRARSTQLKAPIFEYLRDAVAYSLALAEGRLNPSAVIAQERGISLHSAQVRVWIARRRHGLLTDPAVPGVAGGELSELAKDLLSGLQHEQP